MDGDESDASAVLDIIDSNGDDRLGGIDWDERLYSYMIDLYCEENGISADEVSDDVKLSIRRQVEGTKMLLSRKATHGINVYDEGEACHIEVSAEGFKERTSDLVERTMFFVQQLLDDNSVTPDDIDVVLLVGGSTKMPAVKDAVEAMFTGKVRVEDPDLAVAKGAAIAAAIKVIETRSDNDGTTGGNNHTNPSPAPKGISEEQIQQLAAIIPQKTKVYDKLSRSFGPAIMVEDVLMIENLIYAGDKIPASADATYGTRVDNQREVVIGIYENVGKDRVENRYVTPTYNEHDEEQYTDPNLKVKKIGELRLDLLPDMPAGSPIEVSFTCSAAGLDVLARDPKSGKEVNAHIDSENTLSEEEIAEATDKVAAMGTTGSF
jgi:molecular chaperone DnaK (HSP70)